jgi:tetratricopeptide (TPR) repeat protein
MESRSGGQGLPDIKILDFGLARITDTDVAMGTLATSTGEIAGTLPYMSPEQFRGDPEGIDTRTDIYSLGVILYEMLTGRLPLELTGRNLAEAARLVAEQPAPPLDGAWLGLHRPDPDLATIVGKALEKEPPRRYQSAAALADDLDRFLQNQPIVARPPTTFYHLRKAVLRHRTAFAAATVFLALLAGSTVALAMLSARARAARDTAEREAARATAIKDFLIETLGSANPMDGRRRDITVLEALKASSARIHDAFATEPELESGLRFTVGTTYLRLGDYTAAEEMLKESVRLASPAPGREGLKAADPCNALGILRQERGDLAGAETWYRRALAIKRRHRPAMDGDEAGILCNLALLLKDRGAFQEAEGLAREVLAFDEKALGGGHVNVAIDLNNLGSILLGKGSPSEAELLLRKAEAILRREDSAALPVNLGNLGEALVRQGRGVEAEPILAEAVGLGAEKLGEANQDVAMIRVKHGECLLKLGRPAEARAAGTAALPVLEGSLGRSAAWAQRARKLL